MTARTYDVKLIVNDASAFKVSNTVIGASSLTTGIITSIDSANNVIKIRQANTLQEFSVSETVLSNASVMNGTAYGTLNSSLPFVSNAQASQATTASATISSVTASTFIAEKNAFTQNPIVRLYSIYYPGEWFPPNEAGNPQGKGAGRAWPNTFPINFAEIVGDAAQDLSYNVVYDAKTYIPFPVNLSSMEQGSDGKISELSISIYNVDNIISVLVEDPYLVGNNSSNSVVAIVNTEPVHGIDPRTVNATPADVGSVGDESFDSLTRARANGLAYSSAIVASYGTANATFTKSSTEAVKGIWQRDKSDTRDLLGGIIQIKTTFANFLDYWPEYSIIAELDPNNSMVRVKNAAPYRVGDQLYTKGGDTVLIVAVEGNDRIYYDNLILSDEEPLQITTQDGLSLLIRGIGDTTLSVGEPLYIINTDADSDSYLEDTYKIDQLEGLNEYVASFSLVSWLQHFKNKTPKRKYYKNTCQWEYKGPECQYPGPGGLAIPGTSLTSNVNPIAANNAVASSAGGDVCSHSFKACELRNNQVHFGAFPATGRTVPRA